MRLVLCVINRINSIHNEWRKNREKGGLLLSSNIFFSSISFYVNKHILSYLLL